MQRILTLIMLCVLGFGASGVAWGQGDDEEIELPQEYNNEELGLAMNLPEGWVIDDQFLPFIFVANSEDSMSASEVNPDQVFVTLQIDHLDAWVGYVDEGEEITALAVASKQLELQTASSPENEVITEPFVLGSEDENTESDATPAPTATPTEDEQIIESAEIAVYTGTTTEFDVLIAYGILPDKLHGFRWQAAMMKGELAKYEDTLLAILPTIQFNEPPHDVPAFEFYPTRFAAEGVQLSFEYPDWMVVEAQDATSVVVASSEEALTAETLSGTDAAIFISYNQLADLDEEFQAETFDTRELTMQLFFAQFPDVQNYEIYETETDWGLAVLMESATSEHYFYLMVVLLDDDASMISIFAIQTREATTALRSIGENVLNSLLIQTLSTETE